MEIKSWFRKKKSFLVRSFHRWNKLTLRFYQLWSRRFLIKILKINVLWKDYVIPKKDKELNKKKMLKNWKIKLIKMMKNHKLMMNSANLPWKTKNHSFLKVHWNLNRQILRTNQKSYLKCNYWISNLNILIQLVWLTKIGLKLKVPR